MERKKRKYTVTEKTGRPLRDFDPTLFKNLCHIHCTVDELEAVLNCDQSTLDKWCKRHYKESFQTMYRQFRNNGKASLRRIQYRLAEKNAAMAIWLGKQELGQKDKHEIEHTNINKEEEITQPELTSNKIERIA